MDRSNSTSSDRAEGRRPRSSSSGTFAYQARLLESTSRPNAGLLSRTVSRASTQSARPTQNAPLPATTRWTPTHRVGASLDALRGKWEERAQAEAALDGRSSDSQPDSRASTPTSHTAKDSGFLAPLSSSTLATSSSSRSARLAEIRDRDRTRTPVHLKRQTMPSPIVAPSSSLSPESIEPPDATTTPASSSHATNFQLPFSSHHHPPAASTYSVPHAQSASAELPPETSSPPSSPPPTRPRRSNTLDETLARLTGMSKPAGPSSQLPSSSSSTENIPSTSSATSAAVRRRPTSLYGARQLYSSSTEILTNRLNASSSRHDPSESPSPTPTPVPPSPSPASSVMSPTPYRSSYLSSRKADTYGETMIVGRRLGRHLPRIASGDGEDPEVKKMPPSDRARRREERLTKKLETELQSTLPKPGTNDIAPSEVFGGSDVVVGVPGRRRLTRTSLRNTAVTPLPSSKLASRVGGLWADVQRQHLQAYEYLCHIGEAQQWIEGCLGEELPFGVVEMDDGLRNGVVLAKLVRAFQGEHAVRKIYEAPKLDFRHSDNINIFVNFVRSIGLPEGFIFELTDLYEKKNIPKVIYCIHALSHLLARRGLAERIGNLLGQLQFSDDQLQKTQKGLKEAGVAMPNFGNVGRELAKEINEEPEVEVETEEERRDRLLLENEDSIIAFQRFARGFLIRDTLAIQRGELSFLRKSITQFQSRCHGTLARRKMAEQRNRNAELETWVIALQSMARGGLVRRHWLGKLRRVKGTASTIIKVQAQSRGVLSRRRFGDLKKAMKRSVISVVKFQSLARARITKRSTTTLVKTFSTPMILSSVIALQAQARGVLARRQDDARLRLLYEHERSYVGLQAHCRGLLARRRVRAQLAKLENVADTVVRIQAAARTFLARRRLLLLIRGLRRATPALIGLQARARASLARQHHQNMNKALAEVKVIKSVGSFQAFARAAIARNRHREQAKELDFVTPDVLGLQATVRGFMVRQDYQAWRAHLYRYQPVATILQAMLRGVLLRRRFREKMNYYRENLDKVVKIQSLFRAKETREQYRQLTLGKNVNVGTIKNFVHLLDDSEADFKEELEVERLRKKVVESIRENQALENEVSDLDVKISLVVQNVKSFEDLIRIKRSHRTDAATIRAARSSVLAAHGDPFAGSRTLDRTAKRKLELYQQLFYLLQTHPEYLSRLFECIGTKEAQEKNKRLTERVVLTLFGYGQDRREDFLLLKLFQITIQDEIADVKEPAAIVQAHPMYMTIAIHYLRPKQMTYIREALQGIIREVINAPDLNLEVDPIRIHRARMDLEEMRTGVANNSKNVSFAEALAEPLTRAEYIRHLQNLQWWTEEFMKIIMQSTKKMPYGIRFMARETLYALKIRFPNEPVESFAACIGRIVYYRYINPAILTPETFDIVNHTIDIGARKNLAQISRVITQITSITEFGEDSPSYIPINDYVRTAIDEMTRWLLEVADVPDAESTYHAHDFLDATVQPKPIYISPNEIYAMHSLLSEHQEKLAAERSDTLRVILQELEGVPNLDKGELSEARNQAITLDLTNRFANVRDPHAEEKALWVQAKRGVLAVLRVQPAQDLVEALMAPVTDEDEETWEALVDADLENEQTRNHHPRQASAIGGDSAYRLEDIRSLPFKKVKAHAIFYLIELEKRGKVTRDDGFQGILNAIAGDVRSKHRKRIQRQQEKGHMHDALKHLAERHKYFEEQINSYHDYVEAAMATMQRGKGKTKFVLPFTKQYFHLREMQKTGKAPEFGSFKYGAKDLYDKGILLSIDQFSPRQFDKIDLIISSSKAGIFTIEIYNNTLGITNRIATQDLRMEDLLIQARFENRSSLSLFNGLAKVNLDLLLYQINKKFYV